MANQPNRATLFAQVPTRRKIYDATLEIVMPEAVQTGAITNLRIQDLMRRHFRDVVGIPDAVLTVLKDNGDRSKFMNEVAWAIVGLQGQAPGLPRRQLLNKIEEEGNTRLYKPTQYAVALVSRTRNNI